MKRGIQFLVLSQSAAQQGTLMRGRSAFTGCPVACDSEQRCACQHKAVIKRLGVVIGSVLKLKKREKKKKIKMID